MGELLDFLLMVILAIYVIRTLARIFLPMLFQSVVNKAQQQQSQQHNYNNNAPTGKIKVEYKPETKKGSIPDSEGEFVDYEEIK
ncbi:hypothetical protein JN11_02297 [Mucilaginibacter frigoritolerans]|uniref:DUF4834 domain-containing protein n=1 Tax=Mucilaginibacter frigoritolerans TaxID=652788 RepID=A0A562U205_9SPHI|nr:DUF4834 family protein [Mucilaginibacter frigoritolerans]TWI99882.1 hypothetical protein JN11_02297 [Mucilaginibacter frigoritolerans]